MQQADRQKMTAPVFKVSVNDCNTAFNAVGCFHHFHLRQEDGPSLIQEDIQRGSEKRELDDLRHSFTRKKRFTVIDMWVCD